ncbi:MAG: divalent metal cation transporter [Alphaproteobacteria bacterium]|nr:divalent metal cation transporter [Alphaproteobacteria bacterium]
MHAPIKTSRKKSRLGFFAVLGPGIIVMLADTDAGSIVTAAQSGAQWGYRLLLLQLLLIPVLYIVQELTLRLGLVTGCGFSELISRHFGQRWAWVSVAALLVACAGALITELSGMASVGALFGVPVWIMVGLSVAAIIAIVWTGSYHSVERIAIALGSFELAFLGIALAAKPDLHAMAEGAVSMPFHDNNFLYLAVANVGAVIMPWMIFYQQSAVVEKGLKAEHLKWARRETGIGAIATQLVMVSVLVAVAATIGRVHPDTPLNNVQQISESLTPFLGVSMGRIVFALAMSGASLIATIVVALTAAWSVGEVTGARHSLADHPREAPRFYAVFTLAMLAGGVLVASGINLVRLSVGVQIVNALLLPLVLGFLFLLARKVLPESHRLKGAYACIAGAAMLVTSAFSVYAALRDLLT